MENKKTKRKIVVEKLTLSRFKDGFSLIPIQYIATWGTNRYKQKSGQMFFRDYSDLIATKVWNDEDHLRDVLNNWHHCFPREYEIVKE